MPDPLPPPAATDRAQSPVGEVVAVEHLPPVGEFVAVEHLPLVGELSPGWRVATAITWVAVILAFAAVWNTSVQLGLSTWWLGPRADRQPLIVRVSPFFAPVLMLLGTINQARWLAWWGLAASGIIAVYGIGDLGRVQSIAIVELLIAAAAAIASFASLAGTYRSLPADELPA